MIPAENFLTHLQNKTEANFWSDGDCNCYFIQLIFAYSPKHYYFLILYLLLNSLKFKK